MTPAMLTMREAAAVVFIIDAALPDEDPSDVRAALVRARDKLVRQLMGSQAALSQRQDAA